MPANLNLVIMYKTMGPEYVLECWPNWQILYTWLQVGVTEKMTPLLGAKVRGKEIFFARDDCVSLKLPWTQIEASEYHHIRGIIVTPKSSFRVFLFMVTIHLSQKWILVSSYMQTNAWYFRIPACKFNIKMLGLVSRHCTRSVWQLKNLSYQTNNKSIQAHTRWWLAVKSSRWKSGLHWRWLSLWQQHVAISS